MVFWALGSHQNYFAGPLQLLMEFLLGHKSGPSRLMSLGRLYLPELERLDLPELKRLDLPGLERLDVPELEGLDLSEIERLDLFEFNDWICRSFI